MVVGSKVQASRNISMIVIVEGTRESVASMIPEMTEQHRKKHIRQGEHSE